MDIFLSILHVALCFFMILVILLQPGREGGMGGAFGGGAATSAFGGQGATTFLSKVTAGCAIAFFITSLLLSFIGYQRSVVAGHKASPAAPPAATAPADASAEPPETFIPMEEAPPPGVVPADAVPIDAVPTSAEPNAAAAPATEAPANPSP
jgi:preprotein translocase subunit SecG